MAAGSLIGFGLLFVAVTWAVSTVLSLALFITRARLRLRGPWAERRAAVLALVLPPMVGTLITGVVATFSLVAASDHCLEHLGHLHLCLVHGEAWPAKSWALISVSVVGATVAVRLAARAEAMRGARRLLSDVVAFSSPVDAAENADVMLVPTDRALCFTAGMRSPKIYVSRPIWDCLDTRERAAMLAHERAHVAHGDTWRGSILSALTLLGAPLLAASVLERWGRASERLCDRAAATAVGSEADVASAIASVSRQSACVPAPCGFLSHGDDMADRINAVMNERAVGHESAETLSKAAAGGVLALAATSVLLADPLHHALEALLGTL